MAPTGPQLPSFLLDKRKRNEDDNRDDSGSSSGSDSDIGPVPPRVTEEITSKRARIIGPSLPPPSNTNNAIDNSDKDSDTSDEDDDEFGPSLPTSNPQSSSGAAVLQIPRSDAPSVSKSAPQRDDWMIVPPSGGDWTARVDPTQLKNRKFNTGKSAKGPAPLGGSASDSWHETPQEKQARLQREMMGIVDKSSPKMKSISNTSEKIDPETVKRLKEYNKSRGPSLYEAHQNSEQVEKDDDPSARVFDREKDIGGGLQINATQRRDMLKKAADFNSRFSGAKYL